MGQRLDVLGFVACSLILVGGCSKDASKSSATPPPSSSGTPPVTSNSQPAKPTDSASANTGDPAKPSSGGASFIMAFGGSSTGLLLGSWRDGKWADWKHTHESLKGGEAFSAYSLTSKDADYTGAKPELSQASGEAYSITLNKVIGVKTAAVAISGASWDPLIRKGEETGERKNEVMDHLKKLLKQYGIDNPKIDIKKIWTVDLDGVGAAEIIIEATSVGFDNSMDGAPKPKKGDFTMVCLVQISGDGKDTTTLLGGEFLPKKPLELEQIINKYQLANVLDLNGDGKLEVIVETSYYEGAGAIIWDISGGRPKKVLEAADGA